MKILYAASNNTNARIQLSRFLGAMDESPIDIKVAAYKKSSPKNTNVDWTLDALLNIYRPDVMSLRNDNLSTYFDQVKSYAPDLIISDLEYFTSHVASELNIPIWQCSSSLINHATSRHERYHLGLFKFHAYSINRDPDQAQRTVNLIDNSDANLVYSHFGDTAIPPTLQQGFEWIRPYHYIGKDHAPCQHYMVAGLSNNDKRVLKLLKKYTDCVIFTEPHHEQYLDVLVKDIGLEEEYFCNLRNSVYFVCQGQASFLADAFYNKKFSIIYPDYQDPESITNSQLSHKLGSGYIMDQSVDISTFSSFEVKPALRGSVKYLHERIKECF